MDESRVALVTGAGRGIGRHLAVGLADQGLAVGLVGRHADTLEETAEECRARGAVAEVVTADVTDGVAVTAAVDRLTERLGPVDLLVNNAGRVDATESRFVECDLDDVLGVLEVNLVGALRVLRAVLPGMVARRRGRVLDVNSGFAYHRSVGYLGYAVSKAALARVTDLLALDLAADGVVTLDVSPGLVRTDMTVAMDRWQRLDDPPFGDVENIVAVARAFAAGRLDALSGRFVHAAQDDLDDLVARAAEIRDGDTRRLRLVPYGPQDPLAG